MYEMNGKQGLIAEMESCDLIRIIKTTCQQIEQAVEIINSDVPLATDKVIARLQPKYSAENMLERAEKELAILDKAITPYIVEAALRGIDVSHTLQKAYQREGRIGVFNDFTKLLEGEE